MISLFLSRHPVWKVIIVSQYRGLAHICEHLTIIIIEQAFTRIYLFIYLLVFCFYLKIKFKEGWHNAEDNPGMNYVLRCKRGEGGGRSYICSM